MLFFMKMLFLWTYNGFIILNWLIHFYSCIIALQCCFCCTTQSESAICISISAPSWAPLPPQPPSHPLDRDFWEWAARAVERAGDLRFLSQAGLSQAVWPQVYYTTSLGPLPTSPRWGCSLSHSCGFLRYKWMWRNWVWETLHTPIILIIIVVAIMIQGLPMGRAGLCRNWASSSVLSLTYRFASH